MRYIFISFFCASFATAYTQNIEYNRKMVDTLASAHFWGRGYTKTGMERAGIFLQSEFKKIGLKPLYKNSYLQPFTFSANTFAGNMYVKLNGKVLQPGVDYLVTANSKGKKIRATLSQVDSVSFVNAEHALQVTLQKKLTWSASSFVDDITHIQLDKKLVTELPKVIELSIENKLIKQFTAANICGMVKGTEQPDSFIFITAHYDHLGGMGRHTFFAGANDNASGVALLLSTAKYYALHPQKYSIGFILFAAEEIGLLGSQYFTEHPLVPLSQIRFLTNIDLAGTGIEGITVVNATVFPNEFAYLQQINAKENLLKAINSRGKAANSDHYYFTEKQVPSFFFYTTGGITAYHDVYDVAATLPLTEQADLQQLLISFNTRLQQ